MGEHSSETRALCHGLTSRVALVFACCSASFAGQAMSTTLSPRAGELRAGSQTVAAGEPLTVTWAGRAILQSAIELLIMSHGLGSATDVLLSGCSAGGLGALLAAEAVRDWLQGADAPLKKFKVAVWSGIFPHLPHSGYTAAMRNIYSFANVSAANACRHGRHALEPWRSCLPQLIDWLIAWLSLGGHASHT